MKRIPDHRRLTEAELSFLHAQGLSADDVFDCGNRSKEVCNPEAKAMGKNVLLYGECAKAGHRLKTRYGHCIQCDTSKIAFQARKAKPGVVYVMYSHNAALTKIGFSDNISIREDKINHDLLAGANDWTLVFHLQTKRAGELELGVHKVLEDQRVEKTYLKDGRSQVTRECYGCRPLQAVDQIINSAVQNQIEVESYWRLKSFDWKK